MSLREVHEAQRHFGGRILGRQEKFSAAREISERVCSVVADLGMPDFTRVMAAPEGVRDLIAGGAITDLATRLNADLSTRDILLTSRHIQQANREADPQQKPTAFRVEIWKIHDNTAKNIKGKGGTDQTDCSDVIDGEVDYSTKDLQSCEESSNKVDVSHETGVSDTSCNIVVDENDKQEVTV